MASEIESQFATDRAPSGVASSAPFLAAPEGAWLPRRGRRHGRAAARNQPPCANERGLREHLIPAALPSSTRSFTGAEALRGPVACGHERSHAVRAPVPHQIQRSLGCAEFAHQDQPEHDQQQRHQRPQQRTATRIRLFRNRRLAPVHQRHHALPHIENQLARPPEARRVCTTGYSPFSRAIFSIAATLCVCVRCE